MVCWRVKEGGAMPHIELTDDQVLTIEQAKGPVEIRSRDGRIFGRVAARWTAEEIADAKSRLANGTWYSSDEVSKFMRMLEDEVKANGQCSQDRARELIDQLTPVS
jgi:hypothetical protein